MMKTKTIHSGFIFALILIFTLSTKVFAQDISLSKSEIFIEIPQGSGAKVTIDDLKVIPKTAGVFELKEKNYGTGAVPFTKAGQPVINKTSGLINFTPEGKATVNGQISSYEIIFTPSDKTLDPIACTLRISVVADSKVISFSKQPPKTVKLGEDIAFAPYTVMKIGYASGKPSTQKDLWECEITGYDKDAKGEGALGTKTVKVTAKDLSQLEFEIEVVDKVVSIGLFSTKSEYALGEDFAKEYHYILPLMQSGISAPRIPLTHTGVSVDLSKFSTKQTGNTSVKISYEGAVVTGSFKVRGAELREDMISIPGSFTYDGKAKTPPVTVAKIGGYTPLLNKDYTVEYLNNIDAGRAKAVVRAKDGGVFSKEAEVAFDIEKCDTSKITLSFTKKQRYTGLPIKPQLNFKIGGVEIPQDQFILEYKNNVYNGIGTAKVDIIPTEKSNFTSTRTESFDIVDNVITGASEKGEKGKISFGIGSYTGDEIIGSANGVNVAAKNVRLVFLSPSEERKEMLKNPINGLDFSGANLLQTLEIRLLDFSNKKITLVKDAPVEIRLFYPENMDKNSPIKIVKIQGEKETLLTQDIEAEKSEDYFSFSPKDTGLFVIAYGLPKAENIGVSSEIKDRENSGLSSENKENSTAVTEKNSSVADDISKKGKGTYPLIFTGILLIVIIVITIFISVQNSKKGQNKIKRTNGRIFKK
ncbi:MAG: hypothetical protein RR198_01465 [Oscillospiraceae bacterium]